MQRHDIVIHDSICSLTHNISCQSTYDTAYSTFFGSQGESQCALNIVIGNYRTLAGTHDTTHDSSTCNIGIDMRMLNRTITVHRCGYTAYHSTALEFARESSHMHTGGSHHMTYQSAYCFRMRQFDVCLLQRTFAHLHEQCCFAYETAAYTSKVLTYNHRSDHMHIAQLSAEFCALIGKATAHGVSHQTSIQTIAIECHDGLNEVDILDNSCIHHFAEEATTIQVEIGELLITTIQLTSEGLLQSTEGSTTKVNIVHDLIVRHRLVIYLDEVSRTGDLVWISRRTVTLQGVLAQWQSVEVECKLRIVVVCAEQHWVGLLVEHIDHAQRATLSSIGTQFEECLTLIIADE